MNDDENGSIVISTLVVLTLMVLGYIVISNVLSTKEAQVIQDTAEDTIDKVNDVREQAEATREAAENAVDSTTQLFE